MPQIHFNLVAQTGASNMVQSGWTHPDDRHAAGLYSPEYWCDLARTLERGRFDGIFFADTLSTNTQVVEDVADGGLPRADPFILVTIMSQVTKHLGFGATLTTVGTPPFLAVRRLGTVDNLTGGRLAWNVVTGYLENDFKALGLERPEHDLRYDQAEEYMEIAYRLWDAFPAEAVIVDKEAKRSIDTDKVKPVRYAGKYYSCDTLPVIPCSPQGRPLIFQAGASGRGMRFAATHADAVFALQPRVAMKSYIADTRASADAIGRPHPRVFFGVQPYVASTEAEAQQQVDKLKSRISLDLALIRLGAILGRDFSNDDPNKPMEISETQASQGWMTAVENLTKDRRPTLGEMALDLAMSPMSPRIVGTPEQVADILEGWWRETECYGFMFSPAVMPTSIEVFVDHVVPILQQRGLMRTEYAGMTYRENLLQQ
jgi:FMN-dependent oxidoreductase (nitrilotriacetate monooxygenase family)